MSPRTSASIEKLLTEWADKKVRDRAINSLVAFLSRGADIDGGEAEGSNGYVRLSGGEMAKLWKGLFYCSCFLRY